MSLEALRTGLEAYQSEVGASILGAVGRLQLEPPPHVDGHHRDLFRSQSAEEIRASGLPGGACRRWLTFIEAGRARLAAGSALGEIGRLLGDDAEVGAAAARERAATMAADLVAAVPAARLQGVAAPGDWPAVHACLPRLEAMSQVAVPAVQPLELPPPRALWHRLVEDGGYLRRGDGSVKVHRSAAPARCVLLAVPGSVVVVEPEAAGVEHLAAFLAATGESLAWAHLPASLVAEDRYLPGDHGALLYAALFCRRLDCVPWLEARGVGGSAARALRRAARSRRARRLVGCWSAPPEPLALLCGTRSAVDMLAAEAQAAMLDEHLQSRHGRRWDEHRKASAFLRDLWSEGWRRPNAELLSSIDLDDHGGMALAADLKRREI